ncbi:MAG: transcription termination/antitermination NusG family protein [Filifactoraceae bacterium]
MLYVLHVISTEEINVKRAIQKNGIKAYVPREKRLIRTAGKWISREYNLFTGYVFVECKDIKEDYYMVMVPGVISILGAPTPLYGADEKWIRFLINNDEVIQPSTAVLNEDGSIAIIEGIIKNLPIVKIDRHLKRASFEINFGDVAKIINLSLKFSNGC